MTPLQEKLKNLVIKARQIHAQERDTVIDSLQVIGELAAWRAELFMGGKHERVAQEVGLTADQYFKRLRVARLAHDFPRAIQYLREGRTCLSHLALLSDKITKANEQVIWDHVLDKGRREVEDFLRRVECDGSVKDKADGRITIQITVTADEEALIHRLTEVLSASSNCRAAVPRGGSGQGRSGFTVARQPEEPPRGDVRDQTNPHRPKKDPRVGQKRGFSQGPGMLPARDGRWKALRSHSDAGNRPHRARSPRRWRRAL